MHATALADDTTFRAFQGKDQHAGQGGTQVLGSQQKSGDCISSQGYCPPPLQKAKREGSSVSVLEEEARLSKGGQASNDVTTRNGLPCDRSTKYWEAISPG
ncbi:hypothetical protein MRS44_007396 [Fusarium solani]|jgi:hypothetical protein|uniref:uncharacterized protein n=1 Tax=Fusarium solani TaxID=169388 RepID=UPI0032C49ABF|nr:hypothetical protein MRS44_007396 [Fusarium solani]